MLSKNMIFRNTLFGVAVCLAGVLTACAEKELDVVEPVGGGEQVEICFTPSVGGADLTTKGSDIQPLGETGLYLRTIVSENKTNPFDVVATRATSVTGFSPDGEEGTYSTFTVYSFLHDGAWVDNCDSATPYINGINAGPLGNGYWGFENSVFWPAWETNMTFLSYAAPDDSDVDISFTADDDEGGYVYATPTLVYSDPAVADDDTHHGTITDENLAKQYDLLVAQTTDVTKGTTNIPMSFSHVFAAVEFICGDMSEGTISKLSLVNIAHEGVYDFVTNAWDVDTDNRTEYVFDFEEDPIEVPGLKEGEELEEGQNMPSYGTAILGGESTLMMVPQDLTGSMLLIEYTPTPAEGEKEELMELAVDLSGHEWEAGAHVTYHISFLSGEDDIIPYLDGQDGYFAEYVLANYDEDSNGHVSQAEADKVTELKIGYYPDEGQEPTQRIDFTGIKHFTNLEKFTSNYASALDVTQNAELTYICLKAEGTYMSGNIEMPAVPNVSTLDLSKNTKMTEIAEYAFYNNTNLADVTLPETITEIGNYAFYGVSRDNEPRFEKLELPTAVETIGEYAFYGCAHLATINLGGVSSIGKYAFYNCSRLGAADLSKLAVINDHTFMDCKLMTDVTLSESLTAIGEYAFYHCTGLTSVALPSTITALGSNAFYGCSALDAFVCESENPPSTGDAYTLDFGADPKPVLYVYKSYKPNYIAESSGYWTTGTSGKFREIINIDAEDDPVDESTNNHEKYTNGTLVIGTKTVSQSTYGTGTDIKENTSAENTSGGIYFVDPDATLTITNTKFSTVYGKVIIVGNDFEKKSKVVIGYSYDLEPDVTDSRYYVEMMFYNVDIEINITSTSSASKAMMTFYDNGSDKGPVNYLAFDNCHITAKNGNSVIVADVPKMSKASSTYFDEIYIGDCVWELPASTSTTKLFNWDDSITGSPTKVTVKNNVFYCDGSDSLVPDFRFMTANGLTIGTLDYENNTLVNLGTSSTAGVFEYSSIGTATVTKNLTYVAEPSTDYAFFHGAALPTTTTGVTDNIAYLGDGTYTWYWLYNGTSASNPLAVENACTVLTDSPFDALDVSTETFTVKTEYSDYGYQTN